MKVFNGLNFLTVLGLIGVSIFISFFNDKYHKQKKITHVVEQTAAQFRENVFNLHSEIYLTLDRLPLPPTCNRKIFERLMYKYKHIKNIGVIKDGVIVCDVYGASKLNFQISKYKSFQRDQDYIYKYWNDKEYISVASPEGYFVEYDTNYYSNFDIKDEISGLFIYGRQSDSIWFSVPKHQLTSSKINKINSLLLNKFKESKENPGKVSTTYHLDNLIFNVSIADNGSIISVLSDIDYVNSYHKIAFINLLVGVVLGLLTSIFLLHYYYKSKSLKNLLIRAIRKEEINVVYQPLVNLQSDKNEICGFEALARWKLENGDIISPDVFISVAEQNHLTNQLTCLIIKKIFKDLNVIFKQNKSLYVAINVCHQDLYQNTLQTLLEENIKKYGLSPENIVIELTERSMVDQQSIIGINSMKQAGFRISIDDFGTGASNAKYLADLKPNIIKIDKSFVAWSDSDGPTSTLLGSLIRIGTDFDVKIVVEGVETAFQAQRCLSLGAHIGQGYYWYKPQPIQEIQNIMRNRSKLSD